MISNIKYISFLSTTILLSALMATGCTESQPEGKDSLPSIPVIVEGKVATSLNSRAYQVSGQVKDGQYYLSYDDKGTNTQQVALVNFGNPASPETGIVTTYEKDELRWDMVGESTLMFLDNVKGSETSYLNSTTINFTDTYNPFIAAPFDSINGRNDLLWGSVEAVRGSGKINFPLYHNMSRLRVIITADATNEIMGGEVGLEKGATVKITSLAQTPESYNRLNGELSLGENPQYSDLTLVDNTIPGEGIDWIHNYYPDEDNQNIQTFITADFVLPPQILQDEDRPQLVITTSGGKTFSGILPHAMQVNYPDHESPYPVALAFLRQHILTIETVITQDPPELVFMPVKVIEWVDKGEWTLEGHQAGVYLASDFYDLIKYYREGNLYQLERYGYYDEEEKIWIFNFWRSTLLDAQEIANKMNQKPTGMTGFRFVFNGFSQMLKIGEDIKSVTPNQLYDLVTKGTYTESNP